MSKGKGTPPFIDYRHYLLKALKLCDSKQTELGERSGLGQPRIHYLLNRGKKIRYEEAKAIERATKGKVNRFQLVSELIDDEVKLALLQDEGQSLEKLSLSERLLFAMAYEKELKQKPAKIIQGRVAETVAPLVGFRNYRTYDQAKQIMKSGIPELIVAMDTHQLKIFTLFCIARYTPEEQADLLKLSAKEMKAWMRDHPPVLKNSRPKNSLPPECLTLWISPSDVIHSQNDAFVLLSIFKKILFNESLYESENTSGFSLRLLYLSLMFIADETGCCPAQELEILKHWIDWEPEAIQQLITLDKVRLLPFKELSS
jgi:hypothetical protein